MAAIEAEETATLIENKKKQQAGNPTAILPDKGTIYKSYISA
jgi:hypothetical protein